VEHESPAQTWAGVVFFLGLGLVSGALPRSATGWTPRTAATVALTCYCIGLILALIAFMQSRRGQSLDGVTKFLARAPLALVTIGVLIFFLRAMTGL
jgi:integral membrane sensor domain MASE1